MWTMDEVIMFLTLVSIITRALVVEEEESMVRYPVIKHEAWKNDLAFGKKIKRKTVRKIIYDSITKTKFRVERIE